MKIKDAVCEFCKIKKSCHTVKEKCAPLTWVNGDVARSEKLLSDIENIEQLEYQNGNELLATLAENKRMAFETISMIKKPCLKLICAGIWCGMTQEQIAKEMKISQQRISQIMAGK